MSGSRPRKKIPFWQPSREYAKFRKEIDAAIKGCLKRGEYTLGYYDDGGEEIGKFERNFAKWLGVRHCILTGSGTQSLALAYRAAGIRGGEVIAPSHTFVATLDQIVAQGATPVLVDIGDDGLIDPKLIEAAITPKTVAIVPVHLEGKICDMEAIMDIAKRHNLKVIEDAAQAVGASFSGQKAGTIGLMGCFSFYPAKILGCVGNGGAVVTNDDELADRLSKLRCNYSIGKAVGKVEWGYNLEPDAIQAAVLNVKLKYLDEKLSRRRDIADRYDMAFREFGQLTLPTRQDGKAFRAYQDYVIRTPESNAEMVEFLKGRKIGVLGTNLTPNHGYPDLWPDLPNRDLPKTDDYLKRQIRIPCNPEVTDDEVQRIVENISEFCRFKGW